MTDVDLSTDNAGSSERATRVKILCVGPGGQGKTSLEATLPGKKFAYIFDQSALPTLRGVDLDYKLFLQDEIPTTATPLAGAAAAKASRAASWKPDKYIEFEKDLQARLEAGFFDDYDWLIIDSFTMLADLVMDYILYLNGRPGKWPEMADWTANINTMTNIFRKLSSLNINVYCTAHTDFEKDEQTGRMVNQLQMSARLRSRIPMLFSDIWLAQADTDKEGMATFTVQTTSDRTNPFLRNSFRGKLPSTVDVTIASWEKPEISGVGKILKSRT